MWKQWVTLFFWAPKSLQMVTAAMKLKRCLLLGRKAMTNLDSILKSRDVTLPTKVHLVKALVFPVVVYGCESWTVKKTESEFTQLCLTFCDLMDYIESMERKLSAEELMFLNCGVGEDS